MTADPAAVGSTSRAPTAAHPRTRRQTRERPTRRRRRFARIVFYTHLWLGVPASVFLVVMALTGIFLNHKKALGLMPAVSREASADVGRALPLSALARAASGAVPPEVTAPGIDRMDVRPSDGLVKIRFGDSRITEVMVDLHSGEILHVGERNDQFLESIHTGGAFGDSWVLLSDGAAVVILLMVVSGYWLWLYPKSRV